MPTAAAPASEYRHATLGSAWLTPPGHGVLRVTGPDRETFVQGMVTNDVLGLAPGASLVAATLTPKGAMVGLMRVLKQPDALLLDVADGRGGALLAFLSRYLISEEAELSDAPELRVVSLLGPGAAELLAGTPALSAPHRLAVMAGTLGMGLDLDVLVPAASLPAIEEALSATPRLSPETYEVLRIEAGVPKFGAELGESTIPLEANLERAIHSQKGCYIGQEVIARATHRGQVNKRLMGLRLGQTAAEVGAEVRAGERKVGWLTSVARSERFQEFIALGYLHRDFLKLGARLELSSGGLALVEGLPFGGP
jgi:folate-binding protein YgfZ